jgi:hypothetical protein
MLSPDTVYTLCLHGLSANSKREEQAQQITENPTAAKIARG